MNRRALRAIGLVRVVTLLTAAKAPRHLAVLDDENVGRASELGAARVARLVLVDELARRTRAATRGQHAILGPLAIAAALARRHATQTTQQLRQRQRAELHLARALLERGTHEIDPVALVCRRHRHRRQRA